MTSNIGSQLIQQIAAEGGSESDIRESLEETLQTRFLPEFLNRIDETIIFHPLDRAQVTRDRGPAAPAAGPRSSRSAAWGLVVTEAARNHIAADGYDPMYGARPVKRVIQQSVQNPLATELLEGEFPEGATVEIDHDGESYNFCRNEQVEAAKSPVAAAG